MEKPNCPHCGSSNVVKNGNTYYNKPRCICKNCGRQYVISYSHQGLSAEAKRLIAKGLLERISLEGLSRMLDIPVYKIYAYMDELYARIPSDLNLDEKSLSGNFKGVCIDTESDEAWSFVGKKSNKKWIWAMIHTETRQIIAIYVGDRSKESAKALWNMLPENIKKHGKFYTDDWDAYKTVFPSKQHKASKQKQKTNHIERFWCTLRQRCSRLVRETLSFSKKEDRHTNAIRYFVAHYNLSLLL